MAFKRQLAAIMFTDIVGFSQLLQYDEIRGEEALQRHQQTLQEVQ